MPRCFIAKRQSSAKRDGTSGSIRPSRRQSGHARKRRSCSTCTRCSRRSGVRSRPSSDEHQPSASRSMTTYFCRSLSSRMAKEATIRSSSNQVRSIQTQRRSRQDRIQSTWTRMKKRCFRSAGRDWQTQKVRKRLAKSERRNSKKQGDSPNSRSNASSNRLASTSISLKRSKASTTTKRYRLKPKCQKVGIQSALKRPPKSIY